ncbi:MAG: hypothetical protein O7G85_11765 [Planctomycetota bacterium]|nr:hypothetical protein [Planctomycetota bacterium]
MKRHWLSQVDAWKLHAGGGGALALLTLMAYLFGLQPILVLEVNTQEDIQAMAILAHDLDHLQTQAKMHRDELKKNRGELASGTLTLRKASYRNERLALLTELALEYDLTVDGFQTRALQRHQHYDLVPVQLEGVGGFTQCARFLHELSVQFPDTGVDRFELRGNPGSQSTEAFFTFEMTWYAAPEVALADEGIHH